MQKHRALAHDSNKKYETVRVVSKEHTHVSCDVGAVDTKEKPPFRAIVRWSALKILFLYQCSCVRLSAKAREAALTRLNDLARLAREVFSPPPFICIKKYRKNLPRRGVTKFSRGKNWNFFILRRFILF